MTAAIAALRIPRWTRKGRLRRPSRLLLWALVGLLISGSVSTWAHLGVLAATGTYSVGRAAFVWSDPDRLEPATEELADLRSVPVQIWYPSEPNTGSPARYIDNLEAITPGLQDGAELGWAELQALRYVREGARVDALLVQNGDELPLIVLSPGNATNVGFYASIAEELASHGFVVVGVDHPFQVAAVELASGEIAVYQDQFNSAEALEERVADIEYVLDRLASEPPDFLQGRVDTGNVGVLGHSNGGIAAVEACRIDQRFVACLNMDGQNAGGPFGHHIDAAAPNQPFLYLTKETELHPEIARRFEAAANAVRVVVPWAGHGDFADGERFAPSLTPIPRAVDNVLVTTRAVLLAFFNRWLRSVEGNTYAGLPAADDIYINIHPLGDNSPIPAAD